MLTTAGACRIKLFHTRQEQRLASLPQVRWLEQHLTPLQSRVEHECLLLWAGLRIKCCHGLCSCITQSCAPCHFPRNLDWSRTSPALALGPGHIHWLAFGLRDKNLTFIQLVRWFASSFIVCQHSLCSEQVCQVKQPTPSRVT